MITIKMINNANINDRPLVLRNENRHIKFKVIIWFT